MPNPLCCQTFYGWGQKSINSNKQEGFNADLTPDLKDRVGPAAKIPNSNKTIMRAGEENFPERVNPGLSAGSMGNTVFRISLTRKSRPYCFGFSRHKPRTISR